MSICKHEESGSIKGRIHSTESFGAADGPGVRFVVFTQGCPMRCAYCHNSDTWDCGGGDEISVSEILERALRYKSYWRNGGGITVSGGEPLMQIEFVTGLFRLAKEQNVNTALDTAGSVFTREEPFFSSFRRLMSYTDLVILDIKEMDPERHRALTGFDNADILDMAQYLSDIGKPMWLRHVLVPGYTDFDGDLKALGQFAAGLRTVERTEILPYHTMGRYKWDKLGLKYRLDGISAPSAERVENARRLIKNFC